MFFLNRFPVKPIQIYADVPFSGPKYPNLSWTKFFGTNHYHFHLPIGPVHWAKFKKNSYSRSRVMRCTIFGPKMVHLPQTNIFWKIITLSHLLAPFIMQILKKFFSSGSRVMRMCNFSAQNSPFPQMRDFFRKPVN